MRKYIIRRLKELVVVMVGVTLVTNVLMSVSVGDAVDIMYEQTSVAEEIKEGKRAQLGLDEPFLIQYGKWLKGLVQGEMGRSYISGKEVREVYAEKIPPTLELMAVSLTLTLIIATPLGIMAAVKKNRPLDYLIRILSFIGNSMPNFFMGLLLIYVLGLKMKWVAIMGQSVIMPALTLSISMSGKYTRQIRAIVLEEIDKGYVEGGRSRGVGECTILIKSVLRTTLPVMITLVALSMGSLLGGTAIVETIFMWEGLGKMAVEAILMRDYPLIQAYVVWMSAIYVLVNLVADLLYHWLDPRLRAQL